MLNYLDFICDKTLDLKGKNLDNIKKLSMEKWKIFLKTNMWCVIMYPLS